MSLPDVVANPSILLFSTVANNKALSDADAVASDEDIIYMEDLATRYVFFIVITSNILLRRQYSAPSPDIDESDIGTRDEKIKRTYHGLVNIR
jgi:hypothetical protein